ncbi:hypothetical protein [Streptomyces sp. NPDC048188]|uniref:hypothetical protein n=1 Tax=Streptomyces sp. NPDC048188 TaxID=3155749 RepID=UPI00341EBAB2
MSEPIRDLETAVRELGALPMPVGPEPRVPRPVSLTEEQIEKLAAAGNRAVNDLVHDDLCACDAWPERCLSSGGFFQGYWDWGYLETAVRAVLGVWESMRAGDRVTELEAVLYTERAQSRTFLEQRNAHAKELLELRPKYAEVVAEVARLVQERGGRMKLENALRDQIVGLEAEREKLVRWHGEDSKTITTLVARVDRYKARLTALQNDALSMRGSLSPADGDRKVPFELGETLAPAVDWLIARVAELEAAQGTVYRASHDSIQMGLYTNRQAAYDHCEAHELRDDAVSPMAWNVDEDGVADLVRVRVPRSPGAESATGFVVTPLEVASEYDAEADE